MKFLPALGEQVRDRGVVGPKPVDHPMEAAPDFANQPPAAAVTSPEQISDGFRVQSPLLKLFLGQPERTPVVLI